MRGSFGEMIKRMEGYSEAEANVGLRVGVIKAKDTQGTGSTARDMTLQRAFEERGHSISMIYPSAEAISAFEKMKTSVWRRLIRKLNIGKEVNTWEHYSTELEKQIRKDEYDILIGRESMAAYVLCKEFDALKIFDVGNISYIEQYYLAKYHKRVEEIYAIEMKIFEYVDYVLVHDQLLIDFLRKLDFPYLDKIVLSKLGCLPGKRKAQFAPSPKIVVVGLQNFFPHDYFFLSYLTKISKFPIHSYGLRNCSAPFYPAPLNYKGYRENLDFLADYQFGLITVSRDWLREHSPSNKFGDYFSHGLPVLFPSWMKAGYQYKGAIAYDEDNFNDIIGKYSEMNAWARMHEETLAQAEKMSYEKVWQPVLDLVEKHRLRNS